MQLKPQSEDFLFSSTTVPSSCQTNIRFFFSFLYSPAAVSEAIEMFPTIIFFRSGSRKNNSVATNSVTTGTSTIMLLRSKLQPFLIKLQLRSYLYLTARGRARKQDKASRACPRTLFVFMVLDGSSTKDCGAQAHSAMCARLFARVRLTSSVRQPIIYIHIHIHASISSTSVGCLSSLHLVTSQ